MSETRAFMQAPEIRRAGGDQGVGELYGHAVVFNSEADIGGEWRERILPGAFARSIADDDVLAYAAHDDGRILGRTSSGTLELEEDATGLAYRLDLPDTSDGRDVAALVARKDLKGMSFGFVVTHDEWDETLEPPLRTIRQAKLIEISAVGRPAYGDTTIGLRSLERARAEKGSPEHNRQNAAARILRRKVETEHKIRGIRPDTSRS